RYSERGYPLAEIHPVIRDATPDDGTFDLRVVVLEGERVRIERVEFEGLKKSRESLIRRLLPIRAGQFYDQRKIDEARYILLNSGLFASIHPNDVLRGSSDDLVVYRVRVEEARTARFAGVLGYAPPLTETDTPQLTGLIEAQERNLFGTGREVAFRWESGEYRTTLFGYREPFLFDLPLSASLEWESERFEEQSRRVALMRFDWTISARWQAGVGAQTVRAEDQNGFGALSEVVYDSRDYRPNPSRGALVRARGDVFTGDVAYRRATADARVFLPVTRRHTLMARASVGQLFGVDIPLSEWYFLGGADSLRGYREREFRGTRRAFASVEYRVLTGQNSHLFAFFDAGGISDADTTIGAKLGYGVGANIESRGGLVRLQYGLAPGTSSFDGKVHLRLGTVF
ncbi:MAG: BamA/TamA family outer membrane protein, partial [Candidatus Poribacteria bacterium]|nr:BamA/TamA family outer membrane protein [Candidatus Poribacteria bacterium]